MLTYSFTQIFQQLIHSLFHFTSVNPFSWTFQPFQLAEQHVENVIKYNPLLN